MELYSANDWTELSECIQLIIAARKQGLSRNEVRSFLGLIASEVPEVDPNRLFNKSTSHHITTTAIVNP